MVCKYLENRGYTIVERNYLKPWGEIDIVAKKANSLYFIEVKTVSRENSKERPLKDGSRVTGEYRPEDNVHPAKIKRLHRAIQTYMLDRNISEDTQWQLDVACVYLDFLTRKAQVRVLENIIL